MEKRLDVWLVEEYGVKSRSKAQELIRGGYVLCNDVPVTKAGNRVSEKDEIRILKNDVLKYVSRGGLKLEKAISEFNLDFEGKTILDIGSSTGGFTDCALKSGAKKVIAVDVGTDVMDERLREDSRVELYENTDFRVFPREKYADIDFAVCDASFISLPVLLRNLELEGRTLVLIALIKPQFECGMKIAGRYRGVISDKKLHEEILENVISSMRDIGFILKEITWSPICGGDGNIEYIGEFTRKSLSDCDILQKQESIHGDRNHNNMSENKNIELSSKIYEIKKLTENAFEYFKK